MGASADLVFSYANRLLGGLDGLADDVLRRMRDSILPPFRESPLDAALREFTKSSIRTEIELLMAGGELPRECPPVDVYGARQSVKMGSDLATLVAGYHAGHRAQWEAWWRIIESDADLDRPTKQVLLEHGSAFFFDYALRLGELVTAEFMTARDAAMRGIEQRRMRVVLELLDGERVADGALDYPVGGEHLGLTCGGPDGEDAVRDLARRCEAQLLLVSPADDLWWAWLGARRPPRIDPAWRPPEGVSVGFGSPGRGVEGFRGTHRQSLRALDAAERSGRPLVHFTEVSLEGLALRDERAAREFVASELAGIDGGDRRSTQMRQTLGTYFAEGQNARATARVLDLHHQTVAQRLRSIESLLGHAIDRRRAELETALRLRRMLDDEGET